MKLIYRYFFILFFSLYGCGYTPTLAKNSQERQILDTILLSNVEGEDLPRLNRILAKEFPTPKKSSYLLKLKIEEILTPMGILKDGQSTRYKVEVKINYQIKEIKSEALMDQGNLSLSSSYDLPQSEYANYISERLTYEHLLSELCEDLKSRISLILSMKDK